MHETTLQTSYTIRWTFRKLTECLLNDDNLVYPKHVSVKVPILQSHPGACTSMYRHSHIEATMFYNITVNN